MIGRLRALWPCLALFFLLLVPWRALAQPRRGKHPIFIIPGFAASTLIGDFTFPGSAPASALDPVQLEALLLAAAGKNSQKLDSNFFSVDATSDDLSGAIKDVVNTTAEKLVSDSAATAAPAVGAVATDSVDRTSAVAAAAAGTNGTSLGLPSPPPPAAAAIGVDAAATTSIASAVTDTTGTAAAAPATSTPAPKPLLTPKEAAAAAAKAAAMASGCPHMSLRDLDVWLPSSSLAALAPHCLNSLMKVRYRRSSVGASSFANNSNIKVSVYKPAAGGTMYPLFNLAGYNRLVEYIERQLGYKRGVDLFVLPYDFRLDPTSMGTSGQLQSLIKEIFTQVAASKRKAIIIGHSTGSIVGLQLLQEPAVQKRTAGFIALAPPFGGSASSILAHVSGAYDFSLPWLTSAIPAVLGSSDTSKEKVTQWMFNITRGMPSVASMLPYAEAFGANYVAVTVASSKQSYTVTDLPKLLADIKETTLADTYATTHTVPSLLRPIPGVQTFCIYGSTSDTPKAWLYSKALLAGQPNEMPTVARMGKGDGVVNLESLRLCKSIASSPVHVSELPAITHHSVHTRRASLKVIKKALDAILKQQ